MSLVTQTRPMISSRTHRGFHCENKKKKSTRKLRVIMLADEKLLPAGSIEDFSEKQQELRKTEFDVRDAIKELGHEVFSIGVSDDLSTIRGAIDALKPHVAFNLVEEFRGIGRLDQHVVQLSGASQAAVHRLQSSGTDASP